MAEFMEVLDQLSRICRKYKCEDCPMDSSGYCGLPPKTFTMDDNRKVESIVMHWAKKHPEPQYPTWSEWLIDQDIINVEYIARTPTTTSSSARYVQNVKIQPEFYRPIPADIAEKLGLKPKEANGDDTRPR